MRGKYAKAEAKANTHLTKSKAIDSKTWMKMAELNKQGYSVMMRDKIRSVNQGKYVVDQFVGGLPMQMLDRYIDVQQSGSKYATTYTNRRGETFTVNQNPGMVVGKKYKVTK